MLLIGAVALATPAAAQSTPPPAGDHPNRDRRNQITDRDRCPALFQSGECYPSPGEKSSVSAANGILYQMSGSTEVAVDNQAATLKSGDGVFIPAGRKMTLTAD